MSNLILPYQTTPTKVEENVSPFDIRGVGGFRRSGQYVSADFVAKLNGQSGAKVYREMWYNDALIWGMIYAHQMLTRQVEWSIEPADDSPAAAKAKDWLENALFKESGTPWADVQADAATKHVFGFAPCEITLKKQLDGTAGVGQIQLRAQETVRRWNFDEQNGDSLLGLWQQPDHKPEVYIPRQKFLLFRTTTEGGNPEGRSALRGAYKYYCRKNAIEEGEGRASLRSAGLVICRIPGAWFMPGAPPEQKAMLAAWKTIAQELAEDRHGGMTLPNTRDEKGEYVYQLEYLVADGRRSGDMSAIIERMDRRIAMSFLADWILLGSTGVGSLALSSDKTTMYTQALKAGADSDAAEYNNTLVPLLWRVNQFPDKLKPRLVAGSISEEDLGIWADFIERMVGINVLDPNDDDLRKQVARRGKVAQPKRVRGANGRPKAIAGGGRPAANGADDKPAPNDQTAP